MKLCRKCNVTYDDGELCFCYKCGSKLEEVNICPKCYTENNIDFAFCIKCGTKLNGNSAKTTTTAQQYEISKPKNTTSSVSNYQNYQYNTTRNTDNQGLFDNPTTLIMMIVLAVVGLTIFAMR